MKHNPRVVAVFYKELTGFQVLIHDFFEVLEEQGVSVKRGDNGDILIQYSPGKEVPLTKLDDIDEGKIFDGRESQKVFYHESPDEVFGGFFIHNYEDRVRIRLNVEESFLREEEGRKKYLDIFEQICCKIDVYYALTTPEGSPDEERIVGLEEVPDIYWGNFFSKRMLEKLSFDKEDLFDSSFDILRETENGILAFISEKPYSYSGYEEIREKLNIES